MNLEKKKYYRFTGEIPEDFEINAFFSLTDEEVARIRELTVEAYKAYIGSDYDETWASTFEEVCENCKLYQLQGINSELDELLFNRFEDCDGSPFTILSIDLLHAFGEECFQE